MCYRQGYGVGRGRARQQQSLAWGCQGRVCRRHRDAQPHQCPPRLGTAGSGDTGGGTSAEERAQSSETPVVPVGGDRAQGQQPGRVPPSAGACWCRVAFSCPTLSPERGRAGCPHTTAHRLEAPGSEPTSGSWQSPGRGSIPQNHLGSHWSHQNILFPAGASGPAADIWF